MSNLKSAFEKLPPEVQALAAISTAPNAREALRKRAAVDIVEITPVPQLQALMVELLNLLHSEGGLHG
ncbi:MAG: hypothetical protein ACLGJD_05540 [Gammaproteobacteria bacterium]|jgi:hypothetical protein